MTVSKMAFLFTLLLSVSLVMKGTDACLECASELAKVGSSGDLSKACSAYKSCLDKGGSKCDAAKQGLSGLGCSGSGTPVLSMMTMVLGVVFLGLL